MLFGAGDAFVVCVFDACSTIDSSQQIPRIDTLFEPIFLNEAKLFFTHDASVIDGRALGYYKRINNNWPGQARVGNIINRLKEGGKGGKKIE